MFSKNAKWISSTDIIVGRGDKYPFNGAYEFRRVFDIKEVKDTKLLISGLGFYVLYINGKRVNDDVLNPAYTSYDKTVYYVEYDVTKFLVTGKNCIAVRLGNGFYNQNAQDIWSFSHACFRNTPRLILELKENDNTILVSDTSFKYRRSKYSYFNSIRLGEYIDGAYKDSWTETNFNDEDWAYAIIGTPPSGILLKQEMPLIKELEVIEPISILKNSNGYLIDFGVNISGYVSFKMKGKKGETINIKYAEKLNEDNTLDNSNLSLYVEEKELYQLDKYTFVTDEVEEFKPEFVYHGFRYIEVTGVPFEINKDAFKAYFVHTDLKKIVSFKTSDELLNTYYEAGLRSILANYHSIPTDCPHREKNGWTGDAALSVNTSLYSFDMIESYKKYIRDIMDTMKPNGQICCIAPTSSWGYTWGFGPAWDEALFLLPYSLYIETGDKSLIDLAYNACVKYMEFAEYYRSKDGLVCYGIGDWCYPRKIDTDSLKIVSNELSDSCVYYEMQNIMAFMHRIKKHSKDAKYWSIKAQETKEGIRKKYLNSKGIDNNGVGAFAFVLYYKIIDGLAAKKVAKELVRIIKENDYMVTYGVLTTKALFNALSTYGYNDVLYNILKRTEYPSFGYWFNNGATTFFETFELDGVGTRCHHFFSEIVYWILTNVGGIKNKGIGYNRVLIEPYIYSNDASTHLEKETKYGLISVDSISTNGNLNIKINLPSGVKGKLKINKKTYTLMEGLNEYSF